MAVCWCLSHSLTHSPTHSPTLVFTFQCHHHQHHLTLTVVLQHLCPRQLDLRHYFISSFLDTYHWVRWHAMTSGNMTYINTTLKESTIRTAFSTDQRMNGNLFQKLFSVSTQWELCVFACVYIYIYIYIYITGAQILILHLPKRNINFDVQVYK